MTDAGRGRLLLDREALALGLQRSARSIRAYCEPVGYDSSGRALYDVDKCAAVLAKIPTRKRLARVA